MKKFIFILLLLCISPTILALEYTEGEICFNAQQQNCIFLTLLPYSILILAVFIGTYFIFKNKIKQFSFKEKTIGTISAILAFVLINFILGNLFILDGCLLQ